MQNSYNNCGGSNGSSMRGSALGTGVGVGPFNPTPLGYTSCAGNYCVECHTVYDAYLKKDVMLCTHFTITGTSIKDY